jgi:hypothetical protein
MTQNFSREEIYALVWKTPMTKLAARFGLSDVGLRKICKKHDIPTPPLGSDETEGMSLARAAVSKQLDVEVSAANIEVDLSLVDRTIAKLTLSKPSREGLVRCEGKGLFTVSITPPKVSRVQQILAAMTKAAHVAGISIDAKNGAVRFVTDDETIALEVVEVADKVPHVASIAELKAVEKWDLEARAYKARTGWDRTYGRPQIAKWEDQFQGRLSVRLEEVRIQSGRQYSWGPIIRRTFVDSGKRDIIKSIPKILMTVAAIAVAKKENRAADERRRIEQEEAARRYAESQRMAAVEKQMATALDAFIEYRRYISTLEGLLVDLRSDNALDLPERVASFTEWLQARTERLKAGGLIEAVDAYLARHRLCGGDGAGDEMAHYRSFAEQDPWVWLR